MGKPVNRNNVKRVETTTVNAYVNKELLGNFKDYCAYYGHPMNTLFETFMQQCNEGRFKLNKEDIIKQENDNSETALFNTTFNKEIYLNFKTLCKNNGYYIRHAVAVFMNKFLNGEIKLEYVEMENKNRTTIEDK